jgi:endoglucanase
MFTPLIAAQSIVLPVSLVLAVLFTVPAAKALAAPGDGATGKAAETTKLAIKVDQVGYPTEGPKVALVTVPATVFQVRRASNNKVVFRGKLGPVETDPNSGDQVQAATFTRFHTSGSYYVSVPGVGRSWNFDIGANVFEYTYYLAMRGFYGQRCGTAVDMGPEFPGHAHPACHLHGVFHTSSGAQGEQNNIGGWHDAGDYGRYVVTTGISAGTLMWTWEIYGKKIKNISLRIPESGNGTPDILNEARWGLEWMLKMQDTDGGVWHKQTSAGFPGFIVPEADTEPSKVIGTATAPYKSTCATADLAAVAAIAARVYKPFDAQFAARALEAARSAWAWTEKYPTVAFENPPGISTGAYGDANCRDERLWAAAELWRTTGEAAYQNYFLASYAEFIPRLDSPTTATWADVGQMGLWSYALSPRWGEDYKAHGAIREGTLAAARAIVERTRRNPYHVSLQPKDYVWGSNGVAANHGMTLLMADLMRKNKSDKEFADAARDDLHYLLGRNAFSLSWVTHVGENPFQHPHHRPSAAHPETPPWPGLLSGGPNKDRQDQVLEALPKDLPPAKVYADEWASYASNEICINWQASLVFLLAGEMK